MQISPGVDELTTTKLLDKCGLDIGRLQIRFWAKFRALSTAVPHLVKPLAVPGPRLA